MKNYEIRYATKQDLLLWYEGKLPPVSVRAQVIEIDGKLEAIWGVQLSKGEIVAFSTVNKRVRENKRAVVEGIRAFRELVRKHPLVIAYADEGEPTADGFIRHIGFQHIGHLSTGEVYIYV